MMKTHPLLREPAGKALDLASLMGTTGGIALLLSGVFFPGAQALPLQAPAAARPPRAWPAPLPLPALSRTAP